MSQNKIQPHKNSTYYFALCHSFIKTKKTQEQCMEKQMTPQDTVICSTTFSSNKLN